jgi:hypothetical protein
MEVIKMSGKNEHHNWRKLLPLGFLFLAALFILTGCITINQPPASAPSSSTQPSIMTSVPSTQSSPSLTQEIRYTMPPGAITKSTAAYSKYLQQGEQVNMAIQLTGEPVSTDWSYGWGIDVFGPGGESMQQWQGDWMKNNYHVLEFTASYSGTYMVRIGHVSLYPKNLTISVKPAGWGYAGN